MEIKEITNKENWESFLLNCGEKTFLHSWNWGEFQKLDGNRVWRIGIISNEQLVAVASVVKISAKRGTFLFIPQGPVVSLAADKKNILEALVHKFIEIARNEKAGFIRVAPIWPMNPENIGLFKYFNFREAPIHMHAEVTWELDIRPTEDEILTGMRKTTRYLIRQAQKNPDIQIIQSKNIEDLDQFSQIYQETVKRHIFVPFSLDYLRKEFSTFSPDNQISIFLGKYQEEIVSGALIIYWQNMGFYHHGASSSKYSKIPVSYLLQWEAIKEAKKRGCQFYNFWGINENDWKLKIGSWKFGKHPWTGLTLFKMGFGGYRKEYVKTQDLPLSNSYWLTYAFEKIRKLKRGL